MVEKKNLDSNVENFLYKEIDREDVPLFSVTSKNLRKIVYKTQGNLA